MTSRSRVGGARCLWQRWAVRAAQTASLLRRGLRIVPAVISVGGVSRSRRWIAAPRLALRCSLPGAGGFQRLARVRGGGIGAFERLKAAGVAGFVAPSTTAVPMVRGLALVFHPPVLEPDFDLPLGQIQKRGDLHPPGPA